MRKLRNEENAIKIEIAVSVALLVVIPFLLLLFSSANNALKFFVYVGLGIVYLVHTIKSLIHYNKVLADVVVEKIKEDHKNDKSSTHRIATEKQKRHDAFISKHEKSKKKKEYLDQMSMVLRSSALLFGVIYFLFYSWPKELINTEGQELQSLKVKIQEYKNETIKLNYIVSNQSLELEKNASMIEATETSINSLKDSLLSMKMLITTLNYKMENQNE